VNPVKLIAAKLTVTQNTTGTIQSISDDTMNVITNGSIQKWPKQDGIQVGDNIIIQNGRLLKIPTLKKSAVFEV